MDITYSWLIAGVVFIAAEALGVSGVGFLFAGFGAIITGIALYTGIVTAEAQTTQFIIFFVSTALGAALLWKPMQKFRVGKQAGGYSNIVGETAIVGSGGLSRRSGGDVSWSGTIMKAQLVKDASVDTLESGAHVVIVEVSGATLIVKPKE